MNPGDGVAAPMRVAVITPYYREPRAMLERALAAVAAQTHPCTHFMVSDGHPADWIDALPVRHVRLGLAHGDYGDTPRAVGSMLAVREGFDAIAYLDADNQYLPGHMAQMVNAMRSLAADVLVSPRILLRPDGSEMKVEDEDIRQHVDTSCMLLGPRAFGITALWALMPRQFTAVGDRVIWNAVTARKLRIAALHDAGVPYECRWRAVYERAGETPPPDAKDLMDELRAASRWWRALTDAQRAHYTDLMGFAPAFQV